ncbi:MAG: hypothetical protein R3A47_02105 [Polyangiales bacterium]
MARYAYDHRVLVGRWIGMGLLAFSVCGCGMDTYEKELGKPCTRDSQCADPLECREGVCSEPATDSADALAFER